VYLLDTTVWIDLLRTNSSAIRRKLTAHTKNTIGISIITLCELQYGIELHAARHPQLRARNEHLLSVMVAPLDVFPLDHRVVDPYSKGARCPREGTNRPARHAHRSPRTQPWGHFGNQQRQRVSARA